MTDSIIIPISENINNEPITDQPSTIDISIDTSTESESEIDKKLQDISLVSKKARQLVGKNCDATNPESIIGNVFTNNRSIMVSPIFALISYMILGQLLSLVRYFCEILVLIVMPLKIVLHVFSSDSDLKHSIENTIATTSDIDEIKQAYKQAKKLKQKRLDYTSTLLRQTLVIILIKILMTFLPIFELIPFIGLFSNYVYALLLTTIMVVQTPTTLINLLIDTICHKMNIKYHNLYITSPISDKMIDWLKEVIGNSKLSSIRTIRDTVLKYDNKTTDIEQVVHDLGDVNVNVNMDYLNHLGINADNLNIVINLLKDQTKKLFTDGLRIIFRNIPRTQNFVANVVLQSIDQELNEAQTDNTNTSHV